LPINIRNITLKNNIIYEIIYNLNNTLQYSELPLMLSFLTEIDTIKKNIKTINKFRKLHYFIKIKYWLYKYVLQPKIEKKYHPENLIKLLTNDNLENAIENW